MPPTDDIPLFTEVLTEAAETFFGTRREVDAMIEMLQRHVDKLKARQRQIEATTALLNYVLLEGAAAEGFFNAIGVNADPFAGIAPSSRAWIQPLPFAISAKGRFVKVIGEIYEDLVLACRGYMTGPPQAVKKTEDEIYYGLIAGMVELINAEIRRVNEALSPCQSLRFARQFTSSAPEAEVPDCRYVDCLEEKLCFRPLNLDSFNLATYPVLPPLDAVAPRIAAFAKALYRDNPAAIQSILAVLASQARHGSATG